MLSDERKANVARVALISIVDDDESVRESLRGLLRSIGFEVEAFATGEEFLASNKLGDTDCLILDMRMPGLSGLDVQRRLVDRRSRVPVIFITAHGEEESRLQALESGAVDYLFKPFSEKTLLNALDVALSGIARGA